MAEDAFGIVGTVIASAYHVESVVAEGGFGTVYRAHHGGFRAPVALKCLRLPPGLLSEARQDFLESFRAEAELLFRLSASIPSVVRPLHVDAFTLPDGRFVPYIVLEWLEGSTLDAIIKRRRSEGQPPLALKKIVRLLTPVARALERAHNFRGPEGMVSIVHRDIKPENIFVANVAGEEIVKILDFGIGKAKSIVSQVAGRASQGSSSGISTFTPAYGSPEQWAPKRYGQTGPWTDVWGLALTLVEALAGHAIIEGEPAAMMGTVLDPNRRPTPGSEGVIVSDEVERVFYKALALDPRHRYADAGVFWNELLAAARMTSGEHQEVRMPRDARAEPGGGTFLEHVDVPRRQSARPVGGPSSHPAPPNSARPAPYPPRALSAAPELRQIPALQAPILGDRSGSFEVPDLDLAPVSRSVPERRVSGLQPASASLELDEVSGYDGGSAPLDLDLPKDDPLSRRVSSPAFQAVARSLPPSSPRPPPQVPAAIVPPRSPAPPAAPPTEAAGSVRSAPHGSSTDLSSAREQAAVAAASEQKSVRVFRIAAPAGASIVQRLWPGGIVLACAILVTMLDQAYSAASGEVLSLFGLRTSVIAGLFMLLGLALCVYRLKRD